MTIKERPLLLVLAALQFTHIVDFMIMMPLGPQLMRLFDISPRQFSFLVSAYTFSAGIFGFLSAFIIDRFDRKKALQFVYLGFTLGTLACALSPGYGVLLLSRIFTGAFGGIISALILSIIGDLIPNERRATAMGFVMTAFSLASVLGVPLGLYLANVFSWHAPFLFLVVLCLIISIFIHRIVPNVNAHINKTAERPSPFAVFASIIKNRSLRNALAMMVMLMMGQFSLIPFLSPYMVSNVGFTEAQLPLIYLLGGITTIFTLPWIGRMADKHGRIKVFTYGIVTASVPILIITHMPPVHVAIALTVTTLFMVTIGGRTVPAQAMATSAIQSAQRGSFMSINSSVQQLSSGMASFIAGLIVIKQEDGTLMHYNWIGYIALAAGILALFFARRIKSVS
jgi:predicted MFS family arabinose efflux permease